MLCGKEVPCFGRGRNERRVDGGHHHEFNEGFFTGFLRVFLRDLWDFTWDLWDESCQTQICFNSVQHINPGCDPENAGGHMSDVGHG